MYRTKRNHAVRGQGIAEFGLIAPILLFLTMGILDFGRVLFAYANASSSLRDAVHHAEVLGYYGSLPSYLDCDGMEAAARNVSFVDSQTVTIQYEKADSGFTIACASASDSDLVNGDLLQIESIVTINFVTPFLSGLYPSLSLSFQGQRTIVKDITLNAGDPNDTDYDGLDDLWEEQYFGDGDGDIESGELDENGTNDPDDDGCNNGCEEARGTNPLNPDTDGEGLKDGDEAYQYQTDPLLPDTDGDGLNDYQEVFTYCTDELNADWLPTSRSTEGFWHSTGPGGRRTCFAP